MLYSVLKTIKKYNMISQNDRIIVGVSGGPDSIALLHILYSLKSEYSLYIHCAHLNHMLRGREADEDTEYVKNFCRELNIPCTIEFVDINRLSKEEGLSHEEAGRKARYGLFARTADNYGAKKIALAHNMNDQAETILMRIMRGTGLEGLCGIKPVRNGVYIRPLIHTPRKDIEEYCALNNLKPHIDSTNLKPIYARNKVRLELIPFIKKDYNSNIEYSLSSMADILCEDNDFLNEYVNNIYMKLSGFRTGEVSVSIEDFKGFHNAIKKRLVRKAVEQIKGDLIGIESKHIELVLSIIEDGYTGAAVELPGGIRARIGYGVLYIYKAVHHAKADFSYLLKIPGSTYIRELDGVICSTVLENVALKYNIDNKFVKYFDYDKIKDNLKVRYRHEGDYIVPLGMKGKKKLKDFFIDRKVPREERSSIPLVADGSQILWIIGYSISDNFKISKDTKKVLSLEFKQPGGNEDV